MSKTTTLDKLEQAEATEVGAIFREEIRSRARQAILDIMMEEVEGLCGPKYNPASESAYSRAGTAQTSLFVVGRKEAMKRPRVREQTENGGREYTLKSLQAARDPEEWESMMMRAILCGVSCREHDRLRPEEVNGQSSSQVSRLWARKTGSLIAELNERDLGDCPILVMMLDAVVLSADLCAITAVGIDEQGHKHILGFTVGSSENEEVCRDLLRRMSERGLRLGARRLLAVLDGSKALKNAVLAFYPDAIIQRCLVHKERNVRGYLSKRHHGELARLFDRLRKAQGPEAAHEILDELEQFLASKNKEALNSLHEARGELLGVFRLNIPSTLNVTLLSTNIIENVFRNLRRHLGRVARWRAETQMAQQWVASGLILAEKTFRRIRNHKDLSALKTALNREGENA